MEGVNSVEYIKLRPDSAKLIAKICVAAALRAEKKKREATAHQPTA
jgi:hypothetical protein